MNDAAVCRPPAPCSGQKLHYDEEEDEEEDEEDEVVNDNEDQRQN